VQVLAHLLLDGCVSHGTHAGICLVGLHDTLVQVLCVTAVGSSRVGLYWLPEKDWL
jgi:hypothetical protein